MYGMLKNIIEAVYVSYGESKPKIELYDDDTVTIKPATRRRSLKSDGVYDGWGHSIDKEGEDNNSD